MNALRRLFHRLNPFTNRDAREGPSTMADKNTDDNQETQPTNEQPETAEETTGQEQPESGDGQEQDGQSDQPAASSGDGQQLTEEEIEARVERRMEQEQREQRRKELEEQGKYKDAYEDLKQEKEELQAKAQRADTYAEKINNNIEAEIASWPDEVTETDPGRGDVDARLSWVKSHRGLAKRLQEGPSAPDNDVGKGNGGGSSEEEDKATNKRQTVPAPSGDGQQGNPPEKNFRFQNEGDVEW